MCFVQSLKPFAISHVILFEINRLHLLAFHLLMKLQVASIVSGVSEGQTK